MGILGLAFGVATFVFEVLLSLSVLLMLLPSYTKIRTSNNLMRFQELIQIVWVVMGVGMHFSIYVLLYPPFTSFVHVLFFLVLDPFAFSFRFRCKKAQQIVPDEGSDIEQNLPSCYSSRTTALGAAVLCGIFVFCIAAWFFVGIRGTKEGQEPWFPFSGMNMYSSARFVPKT